jgi:hypothetical protein
MSFDSALHRGSRRIDAGTLTTAHRTDIGHGVVPRQNAAGSAVAWTGTDILLLGTTLLAVFLAFLFRLPDVIVSDMDEGTYLYAGKLVTEGLLPYRDFLLAHPPLLVFLAAGWERLFGFDVMLARGAYLSLTLLSTIPLYVLGRVLTRSRAAGLFSVVAYMSGMLLLGNMGRTVRLEPMMNAFLIAGFACCLLRRDSVPFRGVAGVLFAAAILVKLVAVVPISLLMVGELIWIAPHRRLIRAWAPMLAGGAVILLPAAMALLLTPNFLDDVLRSQVDRPGLPLQARLFYLVQDSTRYPLIPLALAAATWFVVRARDIRLKIISLVALAGTAALMLLFKTFFGYYLVQLLPFLALVAAVVGSAVARRLGRVRKPALVAAIVLLGFVLPIAYDEIYFRTGNEHVSSPAQIVPLLKQGEGYMYSMYPSFALASGRPLYPWPYAADSLIPRLGGSLTDDELISVFAGSTALVVYADELSAFPRAQAYAAEHFDVAYQDLYYTLFTRASP